MPLLAQAKDIFVIEVSGVITGYTEKYIKTSIDKASESDGVLMLKIDTPGGLLQSTRGIVQLILESETPVITFVSPQGSRAGSAGTFIALASHFAAMSEGTNIGAAHPVNITGKDFEGNMAKKIENDTVAFMRSIAEKRGRNTDAAIATVTESKSYTANQALSLGIIDAVGNDSRDIAEKAGGKLGFSVDDMVTLKATPLQKVAFFLSDPNVLVLLLFIGILAIVLEFKIPGTFVFAAIGIAAIIMFLMGINIIPINSLGLLLLVAGFCLLGAEIFLPSFGLLTVASMACLGTGLYLLFSTEGNMGIGVSFWLIGSLLALILAVAVLIGRLIFRDFRSKPATGKQALTGKSAKVISWKENSGQIFVHGEIWNATSEETLEKDEKVTIVGVDGMNIKVERELV
ncbi:MAG: serine protease [Denitrovibrio sp.]|nr:MAG: serine protease [Denitrovibrio sp.]